MFAIDHIMKIFPLLEDLEKEHYQFSQEEKRIFCRGALYQDTFEEVQEVIFQAAMLELGTTKRKELLRQYEESLPEISSADAKQVENYIFELQYMCYKKGKVTKLLEDILKKHGISEGIVNQNLQPEAHPINKKEQAVSKRSR